MSTYINILYRNLNYSNVKAIYFENEDLNSEFLNVKIRNNYQETQKALVVSNIEVKLEKMGYYLDMLFCPYKHFRVPCMCSE
jgi:hypothetical protein